MARFGVGRRRACAGLIAVAVLPFGAVPANAAEPAHPAALVVEDLITEVATLVTESDAAAEERLGERLVPILDSRTDVDLIGRLVLGRHWRTATPAEREAYQALFRGFMLHSLVNRIRPNVGQLGGSENLFVVRGTRPAGRDDVIVLTTIHPPGRPPLDVHWRLRERADGYLIIDLVVEGISLLVTQRADFAAVIERGGVPGLLAELRARTSA